MERLRVALGAEFPDYQANTIGLIIIELLRHATVHELAYRLWQLHGNPDAQSNWHQAERILAINGST
jgi:hypothetical protein